MRNSISKAKDQYLEGMFGYIKTYFSQEENLWSWDTFYPTLENQIYDSLAKTYSITISAVKKIYNIKFDEPIDEETLKELTYSKDGKTLEERLKIHYDKAIIRDNPALYFYNRIVLIMDTETLYASNHVIHGKVKKYATHAEIIGSPDCYEENGGMCEYWISKGKMPIEELEELPPYHPDCECEVIYYIDDKIIKEEKV